MALSHSRQKIHTQSAKAPLDKMESIFFVAFLIWFVTDMTNFILRCALIKETMPLTNMLNQCYNSGAFQAAIDVFFEPKHCN